MSFKQAVNLMDLLLNQNLTLNLAHTQLAIQVHTLLMLLHLINKDITTFGVAKAKRTENNLGGDGEERFSVKVKQPPGGGGSLNLFGGISEPTYKAPVYKSPAYKESTYQEPSYKEPLYKPTAYKEPVYIAPSYAPSYEEPSYDPPARRAPAVSYDEPKYGVSYPSKGAAYSYDKYSGDVKASGPAYYGAPGFTTSAAYGKPKSIEPSSLNISSAPTKAFGQRVESGMNWGPTTEKTSIRVHAPPGGKSSIFF